MRSPNEKLSSGRLLRLKYTFLSVKKSAAPADCFSGCSATRPPGESPTAPSSEATARRSEPRAIMDAESAASQFSVYGAAATPTSLSTKGHTRIERLSEARARAAGTSRSTPWCARGTKSRASPTGPATVPGREETRRRATACGLGASREKGSETNPAGLSTERSKNEKLSSGRLR